MNRLRLIVVTSRYWPHAGDGETFAANFAAAMQASGVQVTILTGSWGNDWPQSLVVRDIRIVRVPHAPRGGWSTFRYSIAIARWLRQHRHEFDLVYVLNMRYEAHVALGVFHGTEVPVILRCQDFSVGSDLWWQSHTRFGSRIRHACQQADQIVVPNSWVADELANSGYDQRRLQIIPLGAVAGDSRSPERQARSRTSLSEANHDFSTAEYAPVAVVAGRLEEHLGFAELLREWREIAERWPSAKLWFIGEGSARDQLFAQIADLDLRYQVIVPGAFEDLTDIFQAADVLLWPASHGGRQTILDAMAAGLPVIATDAPDLHGMIEHAANGLLVPANSPGSWTAAISSLFDAPRFAEQLGAAAGHWVTDRYSRQQTAAAHLELFNRSLARPPS